MRTTPLAALHRRLDAKLVPFAGYELPLQYPTGIKDEHLHVRSHAGLFDVSHMCQVSVAGPNAVNLLNRLCPIRAEAMPAGSCRYTLFLNEHAGIIDDVIVTRLATDRFLVVSNAARADVDLPHMRDNAADLEVTVEPLTRALVAVQGPLAADLVGEQVPESAQLNFMQAVETPDGKLICRTGYTGEDGFEIALPADVAEQFAAELLRAPDLWPIGLGARDSLRLEAGLCLYGQDLDDSVHPVDADLMWTIPASARAAGEFIGAPALATICEQPATRRRVGLQPDGPAPIRAGASLLAPNNQQEVGAVTSGGYSPSLAAPIAMAYVATPHTEINSTLLATVRGKQLPCHVVDLPFVAHRYKRRGTS